MYDSELKALLVSHNDVLYQELKEYFDKRYNLKLDIAADHLEVLNLVLNEDNNYELVFLDDQIPGGTAAASGVYKAIKKEETNPSILYLSTLQEVVNPAYKRHMRILPHHTDDMFRNELGSMRTGRFLQVFNPLFTSASVQELCRNCCQVLLEILDVDCTISVIARTDQNPVTLGTVTAHYPDVLIEPYEITINGNEHFRMMQEYLSPIHVPDLNADKELCHSLAEKFSSTFRSALILPLVLGGNFLGYLGAFTQKEPRLYQLVDIELTLHLTNLAAAGAIHIIYVQDRKEKMEEMDAPPADNSSYPA